MRIVNYALGFLGLIAVIIVIYGGVLYVTAAGEDERAGTGKKAITYAVIGLLIVMGSYAFVNTVIKGASGEQENGGIAATTGTTTGAFNSRSEQIRALGLEIFNGFANLEQNTSELKNIKNDASLESLLPENLPGKNEILNFLFSTKSRLNVIKSRLQPFTVAEAKINEFILGMDRHIDIIENLGEETFMAIKNGNETICNPDEERSLGEGLIGSTEEEICESEGYPHSYIKGLYENWFEIHPNYIGGDLYELAKPLGEDYANILEKSLAQIADVFASFQNIKAIQGEASSANAAYTALMGSTAYGFIFEAGEGIMPSGDGFLNRIKNWNLDSSVSEAGQRLVNGLRQQAILFKELDQLKFVQARLTANMVEGSAPMPVIFDILGSVDPAGGSVRGENITWDLAGQKNTTELMAVSFGKQIDDPLDGSVKCNFEDAPDDEFIGSTSKRCIFHKSGTYRAAIKIHSNDYTQYAPGISILQIKVNPPTTEINLQMQTAGKSQFIMQYENGALKVDRRNVSVTASDAENGVRFDASETKAAQYKWNFGDGKTTDFSTTDTADHKYKNPGTYEVELNVLNQLQVADKKIFTLTVSSVAATIEPSMPGGASVNAPVLFDATGSKSDLGKIVNYNWRIEPSPGQNIPFNIRAEVEKAYPLEESGSSISAFPHTFKYPLNYDITLHVTDDAKNEGEYKIRDYPVESKPPVAAFTFTAPDTAQPGTYRLDASASFDPDGEENLDYEWTISPQDGWKFIDEINHGPKSEKPIVKFMEKGDYEIALKVIDEVAADEFHEIKQTNSVSNVLDVAFSKDTKATHIFDEDGKADVEFDIVSDNAIAYEIDFGDGETATGDIGASASHTYTKSGKYLVRATVYDEDNEENTIQKRIFIGGGDTPVANIAVLVNNVEVDDLSQVVKVSKRDIITFDAGNSRNIGGTGRDLKYFWDFGDTKKASTKKAVHSYSELNPVDPGYYEVTLKVADKDNPAKNDADTIKISIFNVPPFFSYVQGIPQLPTNLVTPVTMNMQAYDAHDNDGKVVLYKWWYFDMDDPDEPLGLQMTGAPNAQIVIGTQGEEGKEVTYGFGLEITDSDGLTYSNTKAIEEGITSTVTVTNGPNEMPEARIRPFKTSYTAGDKVAFYSQSTDPDGKIISYIWDFEGDGFYNNAPTDKSTVEHIYAAKNIEGYQVRLKVIDDKGGESVSEPVRISVDSLAKPPVANFRHQVVPGTNGMQVKFINNSTADEQAGAKIIAYKWDFDTESQAVNVDSNGDGFKNNDIDSQAKDPEFTYYEPANYKVKLTVVDSQGNTDEVTNIIQIPLANPPVAAFTYEIKDNQVVFINNSAADSTAGVSIKEYIWDFDTDSKFITADKDGDGLKDNDEDSILSKPVHTYSEAGKYKVKLTVVDTQNNRDDVVQEILFVPTLSGRAGDLPPATGLEAIIKSEPVPDSEGIVYLSGERGQVKFDTTQSKGPIAYYVFDKNIYFDTNVNGKPDDEEDHKSVLPGTYTTNFERSWGRIVVRLTVVDINGNEDFTTVEIKFR
ncbi:PKD domain-containing protein [Candidatus Peregrinibacteria bacterium]|nr:PKD domain-containing protein [Candidatus Peregrinibacteria bacterium]